MNIRTDNELVFVGCFECAYTRKTYPTVSRLLATYEPAFTFIHHPTKPTTAYLTGIVQCAYEASPEQEWLQLIDRLFMSTPDDLADEDYVYDILLDEGYEVSDIRDCAASERMEQFVAKQRQEVINTGIYGTPLLFVNSTPVVGPKPYRVYRFMLR